MSNRNATASWSGFSYQGHVGLLVALRKMQQTGLDLTRHYVQFETYEDVAIFEQQPGGKNYLSVHQVKAYYSDGSSRKSKYSDVLNGPFERGNIRYLHTAVAITDWASPTTANSNGVHLYPYTPTDNHCGVTDIERLIKIELNAILGADEAVISNAYQRLTFELDQRIREEHKKISKTLYDVKFSLQEINNIIRSDEQFLLKEIYECRRLFYDAYIEVIKNTNLSSARIEFLEINIIKQMNELGDKEFLILLQRMNLNHSPERLKSTMIAYNHDGMKQVFFKMLTEVLEADPALTDHVVKYDKRGKFVLTAILEEESSAKTVIENILENLKSQNLLWESHFLVNRNIEVELIHANPDIHAVGTDEDKADDKNKFMQYSDTRLIKRETALTKLNHA